MNGDRLDDEAILARMEIMRLLKIAIKETEKLKLQWEELFSVLHTSKAD